MNSRSVCLIIAVIALSSPRMFAQQLKPVQRLTSNNVITVAGGGDTLWAATARGFHYRTPSDTSWPGFEANNLLSRYPIMGYGNGGAAAFMYNDDDKSSNPFVIWHYGHANKTHRSIDFRFSQSVRDSADFTGGGLIFAGGSFWAPFYHGGLVRYNTAGSVNHGLSAIRPGDAAAVAPQDLGPIDTDVSVRNTRIVLSAANFGDDKILVTAPSALWTYDPAGEPRWDILREEPADAVLPSGERFARYEGAFALNKVGGTALYSLITVDSGSGANKKTYTSLYSLSAGGWYRALNSRTRFSIYPAVSGYMFTYSPSEGATLWADTLTGPGRNDHLVKKLTPDNFRAMLAREEGSDPNPEIQDILFLPREGQNGVGRLAVATAAGLYICDNADLLSDPLDFKFKLTRSVRSVGRGEVYALPGIMRASYDGYYDKSVFVYGLKKSGDVTISVYDYNMSLVKTVVKGKRREAGNRSTKPAEDVWDGTNRNGKLVWPGVYYFKITSTGGERYFGKVIVAK